VIPLYSPKSSPNPPYRSIVWRVWNLPKNEIYHQKCKDTRPVYTRMKNLPRARPIHWMQIWRTTRLAPGTSRMKARLVRLWCFVLTILSQKSLASSSIRSVLFRPPYALCPWMPAEGSEIFHSRESVFFFSFPVRLWGENRRTITIDHDHDRRRNCLSFFVTFQAGRS